MMGSFAYAQDDNYLFKARAYAKLNLNLHILPKKLTNGYSEIKAVNCRLSLFDELIFENQLNQIELIDNSEIPKEENLIYKVAVLLKKEAGIKNLGVRINLVKNIPIRVGLGGGSSDAAITLKSLNQLWNLNYSNEKLLELGNQLGSDINFCLTDGVVEVGGQGEKINVIAKQMPEIWGLLIIPKKTKLSTKWAYENLDRKNVGLNLNREQLIVKAIKKNNFTEIVSYLYNDFEELMVSKFAELEKIKKDLLTSGAENSLMTGAGLGVIGFFKDKNSAETAKEKLENNYKKIFLVKTL